MRKNSRNLRIFSTIQCFNILIVFSSCNSDTQSQSIFYDDCVDVNNNIANNTLLKNCVYRSKHKELVPRIKRNTLPSEPGGLIPLFEDDSDLEHLTKFSATEFLDKILGRRIFNTTMNIIVPMFHVTLPMHASSGSTMHLAMQATLGLFSLAVWAFTIIIPSLFTYIIPFGHRSFSGTATTISKMSHFNHKKFNELSEKIGLDWNTCMMKTVCEAHRFPKKYGILSVLFQVFSPLRHKITDEKNHNSTTKHAAGVDVQDYSTCDEKFKCFFDILDLGKYLVDLGYHNYLVTE